MLAVGGNNKMGKNMTRRPRKFKAKTSKPPLEFNEQVGFVDWFRAQYPRVLIFAVPNGGKRNMNTAKNLKAEGVVAGIPDLYIPAWNVWVEMKRVKGGRISTKQKDIHIYLEGVGHTVIIGYGARDASEKIQNFLQQAHTHGL